MAAEIFRGIWFADIVYTYRAFYYYFHLIKGEFHCDVCKENFPFQSRLIRHLNTAAHRIMEATFSKHHQSIPKSTPTASVRWYLYERYTEGAGQGSLRVIVRC